MNKKHSKKIIIKSYLNCNIMLSISISFIYFFVIEIYLTSLSSNVESINCGYSWQWRVSPSENVYSNCSALCLLLHSSSHHESPETQNISCTLYNYPLLRIAAPAHPLDNPARNTWRHRVRPPGICSGEMPRI